MKNNKNKNLSKKNIDEKDTEKISGGKKVCDSIFSNTNLIKNLNTTPLLAYGGPSLKPQPLKYGGIRPKKTSEEIKDLMSNYEDKDKNK